MTQMIYLIVREHPCECGYGSSVPQEAFTDRAARDAKLAALLAEYEAAGRLATQRHEWATDKAGRYPGYCSGNDDIIEAHYWDHLKAAEEVFPGPDPWLVRQHGKPSAQDVPLAG